MVTFALSQSPSLSREFKLKTVIFVIIVIVVKEKNYHHHQHQNHHHHIITTTMIVLLLSLTFLRRELEPKMSRFSTANYLKENEMPALRGEWYAIEWSSNWITTSSTNDLAFFIIFIMIAMIKVIITALPLIMWQHSVYWQ